MTTVVGVPPGVTASGYKSVPWTPARLPLAGWWDASDAATIVNPGNITAWNDKSGNGHHLIPSSAGTSKMFTIKGKQMVGTTPIGTTATGLRCTGWTRQAVETIVGVFWTNTKDPSYPMDHAGFWNGPAAGDRVVLWNGLYYSGYNVAWIPVAGPLTDNLRVYAACSNGASSWFDIDRVRATGSNSTTPPVDFIVASDAGWSGYTTGGPGVGIGEVFVINGTISAADLTNLYNYLSTKWGTP